MKKLNCWEHMKCGREPGGNKVKELGICPAAIDTKYDGVNKGKNAGRFCWAVAGTMCNGEIMGYYANKFFKDCLRCPFYKIVEEEEGRFFILKPNDTALK